MIPPYFNNLDAFDHLGNLERLISRGFTGTAKQFREIFLKCPKITHLDIRLSWYFKDTLFYSFPLVQLRYLNISDCPLLTDNSLEFLSICKHLEYDCMLLFLH